ncbi:glycogen synthase [[Mycoplasma] mobile]|uniref:Glycogen synthase n=1 Tax=Mycoplasma mobile (strain ATCC 43663 / 163K / NCTC 11711) TaxID=267748 RepID=GLGA_MYCM1|nr:glycogen/starch synthase [[Mycoplasma] mobile]Q6KHP2.1 RecName: Full=Glycogen synthase; AltName: Full=Starch [bacterial glycogen] synthase [Mycoplasma mobile 163K]AAT27888.1 glycogen synthase [Mycoplasma mobile 163K]
MKILYISVECFPFIKTGGLGDVAYSFPKTLKKLGNDIKVFLIYSDSISEKYKEKMRSAYFFSLDLNGKSFPVEIFSLVMDDIEYLFFNDPSFKNIERTAYLDLHENSTFYLIFNKAISKFLELSAFKPEIIHANDWHTGILPLFLSGEKNENSKLKVVFTIHNLQYQGVFGASNVLKYLNEKERSNSLLSEIISNDIFNFMKAGIISSDIVTTVSETYKEEIKQPMQGMGLESVLNKYNSKLRGIINGLDYDIFNPSIDKYIEAKYDVSNYKEAKLINKIALQKELNLEQNKKIFLIGMISRLANQKGIDLVLNSLWNIVKDNDIQFVVLGTGDVNYESNLKSFGNKYPRNFKFINKFSDELSHKLYAGLDAFLIPSLFEPCGLTQLISLKYGCIPIARATGGLIDTITSYNDKQENANGFLFKEYTPEALYKSVKLAKNLFYNNKPEWNKLIYFGMDQRFGWEEIAKKYLESIYK